MKNTQHRRCLREFEKITAESPLQFTQSFSAGLCPWPHAEGHAALLSVQELVFQALDRFGKPLRQSVVFLYSHSCLLPYLQLHWQGSSCVSPLIHFQQSPTSLIREVRPQAGTSFQI